MRRGPADIAPCRPAICRRAPLPSAPQLLELPAAVVVNNAGDVGAGFGIVKVLKLVHGITRADSTERLERRQRLLDELLTGVPVQPVTIQIALRAGQIDGQVPGLHVAPLSRRQNEDER